MHLRSCLSHCLLGLALATTPGFAAETAKQAAIDSVVFGDAASEKSHGVADTGTVAREKLAIEIGLLREKYPVATVSQPGSQVSVTLQVARGTVDPATPIILEVQEIHNRRPQVFGYTVQVNGKDTYFRTYDEMAAGPNHYFVQIPGSEAPNGVLQVAFRNEGSEPFSLGRVWAYADFAGLAGAEGTYKPMPTVENATVLLPDLLPKGADGKVNRWGKVEPAVEAAAWKELRELMQGTGYTPGIWTDIQYAKEPFEAIKATIDKALERVATHGVEHQISFRSTEWGTHPNGMDGLGGFFSDITYSKVIFDEGVKDFRPSWHRTSGNTTWPTWNHPQLNTYLDYRLGQAIRYYRDRRDVLAARGTLLPMPSMDQEWGLSIGDSNDATIRQAKKDGVALNPQDGLTDQEKRWVFDNMCQVANRFGTSFADGIGRDTVLVDRGQVQLPAQQTRDENYVQTFADPVAPYFDHQWAGWQVAVGPHAWATGEFLPQLPHQYYDYINAQGRLSCPNMERMGLPTLDFIQTVYTHGFRMVTFLNAYPGDAEKLLLQAGGMDDRPAEPPTHSDRKLISVRYAKTYPLETDPKTRPHSFDNLEIKKDDQAYAYDWIMRKDAAKTGQVTYRVANDFPDANRPLLVNLICQVPKIDETNPDKTKDAGILISVGDTPDSLKPVETITGNNVQRMNHYHWRCNGSFDLGAQVRNKKSFYLRFTLTGKNTWDSAIERFQVVTAWPKTSGQTGGQPFTAKQMRTQRLWLQDRAVYQRALADFRTLGGSTTAIAQATALADQGRYLSAYQALSGATSLILPARFAIRGHGTLADYPVSVKLPDDDQTAIVELLKAGPTECVVEVKVETPQRCSIELGGVTDGTAYTVEKLPQWGVNRYRIALAKENAECAIAVDGGKLVIPLEVAPIDDRLRALPRKLSGIFAGNTKGGILINTQDPTLWMDNPIFVPLDDQAKSTRTAFGTPPAKGTPKDKDRVDLVIDEKTGKAIEVAATHGIDAGRIKSFTPPRAKGEMTNGIIELDNGNRYELSAMWGWTSIKIPPLKVMLRQNSNEQLSAVLTAGKTVEITFCPYATNDRLPRIITLSAKNADATK